jgi:hypothetical protein
MPRKGATATTKPSYKDDRVAWNQHWEREHDFLYGSDLTFRMTADRKVYKLLDQSMPAAGYDHALKDSVIQNGHQIQSQVRILQQDLAKKASVCYAEDDFVHRWTKVCTPAEREEWILEGLVITCESNLDFEPQRRYCPELSLKRLNHDSGKGFLRLLEGLMAQESDGSLRSINNPIWEAMNDPSGKEEGAKVVAKFNDLLRTSFMTYFVWNTLLAFVCFFFVRRYISLTLHPSDQYGESENYKLMKTGKPKIPEKYMDAARDNKEFAKIVRQTKKETVANYAIAERMCSGCGLTAELSGVKALLVCQKCKGMGRDVYYCNR